MTTKTQSRRRPPKLTPLQKLLIAVVVVAVVGFGGLWLTHTIFKPKPHSKVLQSALADQFGSDAGAIVPNVPSRNGRYPGAVLAVSAKGSELLVRRMERPEAAPAASGSLNGVQLSEANAAWQLAGRAFGARLEGKGSAAVEIDLQDIRIFEQEAAKLAADLRSDESVSRARASGQSVVVVTKAYEAVPVLTVRQRSDAKSEDWAKLKGELTKAKGELSADNSVVFRSAVPQVVAYETSEVKFIAGSFSGGDVKLELKRRLVSGETSAAPQPADFGAKAAGGDVTFAVIASPVYTSQGFGDLPAATASTALVDELFAAVGAKPMETGLDPSARLTTEAFAAARAKLFAAVKASKPRAFVLYYAGHAVSGMAGAHYLVLGDYQGKLADDLKQTSPFVPPRGPTHPLAGSNIDDIAKAIAAAGQELATTRPGLVAVADLHRELTELGVPFAIVVDGCYAADAMNKLREELRLTPWGDYYGTADSPMGEIQEYQRALRTYGEAPYLRSANPVIFAARPGTLAPVVRHPFFDGDLIGGVGPLAAKLGGTYLYALENREDLPLGVWLRRITDFAGTGELDVRGSISWSNFDALREVPMVSFGGK
jgi:hypothetical protein